MNSFLRDILIDKAQATKIVNRFLHDRCRNDDPDNPVIIREEATVENDWCWVFFYDLKSAVETPDGEECEDCLLGNNPLVVDKIDGSLHHISPRTSLEKFFAEYEKKRRVPQKGPKIYELEESN